MGQDVTTIQDVLITELRQIEDRRGAVLHMLRNDSSGYNGFGECYFSEILPGAIKAWKRHRQQTQNFAVPIGRIKLVVFDGREKSTSRGELMELELGRPDRYLRITIPPDIWYGFICISSTTALLVNCADIPHCPEESEIREPDTTLIPYDWWQK